MTGINLGFRGRYLFVIFGGKNTSKGIFKITKARVQRFFYQSTIDKRL